MKLSVRFVGLATLLGMGCATNQAARSAATPSEEVVVPISTAKEDVVPPEKLEEIELILERKQKDVAHCWTDEAERTHNRNLVIDLMLKFTIEKEGRANDVQILKDSVSSKEFESCVLEMVKAFDFPAIPSSQEMTWQYKLKPLY